MPHKPALDAYRAFAILLVMLFHGRVMGLGSPCPELASWGWIGVDMFFVLSGYLIAGQLLRSSQGGRQVAFAGFYLQRAFRILPLFLVVLSVYFLFPSLRETPAIQPLWQFLSFSENLLIDYSADKAFSHVWSLCVEEHFYLCMPLLVWAGFRSGAKQGLGVFLLAVVVAGLVLRHFAWLQYQQDLPGLAAARAGGLYRYFELIYYPSQMRLDGLVVGVGLAWLEYLRPQVWKKLLLRPGWLLASFLVAATAAYGVFLNRFGHLSAVLGFPLLSLALGLLLLLAASLHEHRPTFPLPGARLLARLAFALYLSHKLVFQAVHTRLLPLLPSQGWLALVAYTAACLLAAAFLHLGVERPFLTLRKRLHARV